MRNLLILTALALVFLAFASVAEASVIVVDNKGEIIWKVLASHDWLSVPEKSSLQVKKIAETKDVSSESRISLKSDEGYVILSVTDKDSEKTLDVTEWKDSLIELEQKDKAKKVKIGLHENRFLIEQQGVAALTDFPINISPKDKELSVVTSTGIKYVSILPMEAYESLLRAKLISGVGEIGSLELVEREGKGLTYAISGEKTINLFNVLDYSFPVSAWVSASTGEVLEVDQPTWYKVFGFLFV